MWNVPNRNVFHLKFDLNRNKLRICCRLYCVDVVVCGKSFSAKDVIILNRAAWTMWCNAIMVIFNPSSFNSLFLQSSFYLTLTYLSIKSLFFHIHIFFGLFFLSTSFNSSLFITISWWPNLLIHYFQILNQTLAHIKVSFLFVYLLVLCPFLYLNQCVSMKIESWNIFSI